MYIQLIFLYIYSDTRSVLGLVPVRFSYFEYRNIRTVQIFEGLGPVPVLGISVWFWFGSLVPVFLPMPSFYTQVYGSNPKLSNFFSYCILQEFHVSIP